MNIRRPHFPQRLKLPAVTNCQMRLKIVRGEGEVDGEVLVSEDGLLLAKYGVGELGLEGCCLGAVTAR